MSKPVVLLYEPIHPQAIRFLEQHAVIRMASSLLESDLIKIVGDVEGIIIRANGRVSRRLMEAAPRLKVVGRHGVGVEAIDRQAAAELGIVIVNTPDANLESVAEQCVGFMIVLAKKIRQADQAIRSGDWEARHRLTGIELAGKTLGIVGFGRIGQRVAEICHVAFGMPILYFDALSYPNIEEALGAQHVTLDYLLQNSDFVSLHVPLLPSTQHLISAAQLRQMKPTAFLINTARGQVVDQIALIQALQEKWIAGAGLDVYDPEPLSPDHPLYQLDNVILSPHMAAHTEEALLRMAMVVEDVVAVIHGREPRNPVKLS